MKIIKTKTAKISDYFEPEESRVLVQAKIEENLHQKVKEKLKSQGRSIQELVTASFQKYLNEHQGE